MLYYCCLRKLIKGVFMYYSKYYREGASRPKGLRTVLKAKNAAAGRKTGQLLHGGWSWFQDCPVRELGKSVRRWETHVLVIRGKNKEGKKIQHFLFLFFPRLSFRLLTSNKPRTFWHWEKGLIFFQ